MKQMALKQKILSLSLAASTLLGAGLSAQDKTPEKQSAAATQTTPKAEEMLMGEQQAVMLKKLVSFRRRMERSCKMEILKMERKEARKITQAKRVYKSVMQKANRATARGDLSATDVVVLQANIEQARKNVELYEDTIDETIQKQADKIQKRYDKDLKEIDQTIQDVKDGKMPKIRKPEPKEKQSPERHQIRMAAGKDR